MKEIEVNYDAMMIPNPYLLFGSLYPVFLHPLVFYIMEFVSQTVISYTFLYAIC